MDTELTSLAEVTVNWDYIKTVPEVACCKIPEDIDKFQWGILQGTPLVYGYETFKRWCVWFPDAGDYLNSEHTFRYIPVQALTLK